MSTLSTSKRSLGMHLKITLCLYVICKYIVIFVKKECNSYHQ